jgi:RNA polymerase-binding transcription factor DksA
MKRVEVVAQLRPILMARRAYLLRMLDDELNSRSSDEGPYEDEICSQLSLSESRELEAIGQALHRMREGSYGICDVCGRNIAVVRLKSLPHATTCVECQRRSESRGPFPAARQVVLAT